MMLLYGFSSPVDFWPHGVCYQWKPSLILLHGISDALIALAYGVISVELIRFVNKRRNLPLKWMFACFGIFILACGVTHAMEVLTLWIPAYWISGEIKVITAIASLGTAGFLVRSFSFALTIPNPSELKAANEELERQGSVLRESEERFQRMASNIQEIFWMMNPKTAEVIYVSPAFETICERRVADLISNPMLYRELIHPEDRDHVLKMLAALENTNRFEEEFRIICPSGTFKWVRALGFNSKDSNGVVTAYVGTVQEITARKQMEFAIRESEYLFRDLVEHSCDLICTHDLDGRILSVNELPAKVLGYAKEELLNKPIWEFLPPEAKPRFSEAMSDLLKNGFVKGRMVVLSKSGERRTWEYHNTLRTNGAERPIVRGVAHDITEQMRMEQALRRSEEKFSKAFQASPYAIVISTIEEGRLLDVNDSFLTILGFTREESLGCTSQELGIWLHPPDRSQIVDELLTKKHVKAKEVLFRSKSGKHLVVNYSAEVIELDGHKRLLSVCEDISHRKSVENELRKLSGELLRLQDEERRKIARDLHDSTGQELVALAAAISRLTELLPSNHRKYQRLVRECQKMASNLIVEIRTLSYLLHPPLLDEAGLEDAIQYFVDGFQERTGIEVKVEICSDIGRLPDYKELALFRVVQESLINIHRHSGSCSATIILNRLENILALSVTDSGRGFGRRKLNRVKQQQIGVGLPSMKERMRQVGGRLCIESSSQGTTISAEVPVCA